MKEEFKEKFNKIHDDLYSDLISVTRQKNEGKLTDEEFYKERDKFFSVFAIRISIWYRSLTGENYEKEMGN